MRKVELLPLHPGLCDWQYMYTCICPWFGEQGGLHVVVGSLLVIYKNPYLAVALPPGSQGGRVPLWQWKICLKSGKRRKKSGKGGKIWKRRKNWDEKAKIKKGLILLPSWQVVLATLLVSCIIGQSALFPLASLHPEINGKQLGVFTS